MGSTPTASTISSFRDPTPTLNLIEEEKVPTRLMKFSKTAINNHERRGEREVDCETEESGDAVLNNWP